MGQCLYRTEYNKWERSPSNNIIKKLCTMYIVSNIKLTRHLNIVYSIHFNLEFVTLFGTLKTQLKLDTFERKITSPVNLNCLSYWLNLPWVYSTNTSQTQAKHTLPVFHSNYCTDLHGINLILDVNTCPNMRWKQHSYLQTVCVNMIKTYK